MWTKVWTRGLATFGLLLVNATISLAQEPAPVPPVADAPQAESDWPGSFSLAGSKTRFAIGGFAQLDVIHDDDAIGSPGLFITATIPTDGGTWVRRISGLSTEHPSIGSLPGPIIRP